MENKSLPFQTTNTILALCLDRAGVPLCEVWNVYTEEQLRKLRMTAREAKDRGQPGTVTYYFERVDSLQELLAAFADEEAAFKRREESDLHLTPEQAVRFAYTTLKKKNEFALYWRQTAPKVQIRNAGQPITTTSPSGVKTTKFPGFRLVSVDASDEVKRDCGFAV